MMLWMLFVAAGAVLVLAVLLAKSGAKKRR
ncbi:hypothetical protein PHYC_02982 [Phycisphaerales bacterium]|nr:hypothetical protein PHYC_02982 [Phycisphaerales bacterium]